MKMMKFASSFPFLLAIVLFPPYSYSTEYEIAPDDSAPLKESSLDLIDFQHLLFTEIDDEIDGIIKSLYQGDEDDIEKRNLREDAPELVPELQLFWEHVINHGWHLSEAQDQIHEVNARRKLADSNTTEGAESSVEDDALLPFLVCSRTPLLQSGAQRLPPLLQFTGAAEKDTVIVSNDDEQTCFCIPTTFKKAKFVDSGISNEEYVIVPFTDLMKISSSTINQILSKEWSVPTPEERLKEILRGGDTANDWERIIRITFVTGHNQDQNENSLIQKASKVLSDIKASGKAGYKARRRRLENNSTLPHSERTLTVSDSFSLTSSLSTQHQTSRRIQALSSSRMSFFSRALESGVEASHFCDSMFKTLSIRAIVEGNGVDIVLNPTENSAEARALQGGDIESSACNPNCVISLIIGLSAHPSVANIELDLPVTLDDYESQWITQSNIQGRRPFFQSGLTGKGQIVSITDSGLDINHKFFGPTNGGVHQNWVMSERKVVRYKNSASGDKVDTYQGHGTRVAGIIAGKLASNVEDKADGVAPDAKLHMWDIQKGTGGFASPGPNDLFSDIYQNGRGAKITNGSWSAGYRPYSTRCRMFDSSLRDRFDSILFVASAGNAGNDVPGKVANTIGDPSSCKNIMSVGASQSTGERLYMGDKGKDYLADFSSRGPTMDGRMKPDIVAPGYTVLAPRAYAKDRNSADTFETFGTSFSAPVVAGNAALVRQYFEEGWFPCGSKGCGRSIDPSGSLVKAVLMNGAQSLKSVQKVPRGPITEQVREYDNNQGMGLLNLSKSLPLKNANQFTAIAVNNRSIRDGASDKIIFKTKQCQTNELSVTLSWYDPAGSANCARCLVNDLDLTVKKNKVFYPNGGNSADRKNNVERIRLTVSANEQVEIVVTAHNLATPVQKYSLIATGCFDILEANDGVISC